MRTAAVIGCGKVVEGKEGWAIGHQHARGWLGAFPEVILHGVDISRENLDAFGQQFGIPSERLFNSTDELYQKLTPDYVSVCTWPRLHAPQTIDAAKRGVRGIICEKPLALNVGEIREMIAVCDKAGARLAVGHLRRLEPIFRLAKDLLHSGAIGDKWMVEARVGDGWDILSWTTHWFDMVNFLFDAAPKSVLAGMDHRGHRRYQHAIEDSSVIFCEYPEGRQALFVTGPENPSGSPITVRGTEGILTIYKQVEVFSRQGYRAHNPEPCDYSFIPLIREVVGAVERGTPMGCDAKLCAAATEVAYAAYESARIRKKVALPLMTLFAPFEILQHPPRPALKAGKIVLLADDHWHSGGGEGLREALAEATGREIEVHDATQNLAPTALDGAAYLLLYHTQAEAGPAIQAALQDWVNRGNPLALVHAALGAYPGWKEYAGWAGRIWNWDQSRHPHEESVLRTTAEGARILGWEEAWLPRDEVFVNLKECGPCRDLASAQISEGTFAAAWINDRLPNVGVWVPGHRNDLWTIPVMREGLIRLLQAITIPSSKSISP
jgi:predicted dehydrogenase